MKNLKNTLSAVAIIAIFTWTAFAFIFSPEEIYQSNIDRYTVEQERLHERNNTLTGSLIPNAKNEMEIDRVTYEKAKEKYENSVTKVAKLEGEYWWNKERWTDLNNWILKDKQHLDAEIEENKNIWNLGK